MNSNQGTERNKSMLKTYSQKGNDQASGGNESGNEGNEELIAILSKSANTAKNNNK